MEENDFKPLSEEERRANLRALLGEEEAESIFENSYGNGTLQKTSVHTEEPTGLGINWRFVGIVSIIFAVVMTIVFATVLNSRINEETISPSSGTSSNLSSSVSGSQ